MPFLRNAVPDFLTYWRTVSPAPVALKLVRWGELYARKHEPFMSFYSQQFSPDFHSAFRQFPSVIEKIGEISETIEFTLREIESKLQDNFDREVKLNVFLFVGGFGSSAFVAYVEQEPWLWLASERLCEYHGEFLRAKVAHESVHSVHLQMLRRNHPGLKLERYERTLAYHLFSEGLATIATKMMFPELGDAVYMLLENGEEELEWCVQNEETLLEMMSNMLEAEDHLARAIWFGAKHHERVPYTGTGFYVGAVAFQELLSSGRTSLKELAGLHPREHIAVSIQALRGRSERLLRK